MRNKHMVLIAAWLTGTAFAETILTSSPQPPVMEVYTIQRLEQIQAETVLL